jgi:hypothetical protein
MWALVATGWSLAWFGVYIAYAGKEPRDKVMQIDFYHVPMAQCDTDSDCMDKFGGDGGPEPIRTVRF